MSLWAIVVLLTGTALAAPCPGAPGEPCTPSAVEKGEVLRIVKEAFDSEVEMKEASKERELATARGDYEETERLTQVIEDRENLMNKGFADALTETAKAYNVGPRNAAGSVALPKDPFGRGAWAAGLPAYWAPQVRYELKEIRRFSKPDGSVHFVDGTVDPANVAGVTYPDGEVRILAQNLREALVSGNPGRIAYILHHEARHFDDIVSRGQSGRAQDELRAYTDSVRDAAIFELDPKGVEKLIDRKAKNMAIVKSGAPTSFFPDAQQELDLSMAYDQAQRDLQLYNRRREEIRRLGVEAQKNRLDREAKARLMAEYQASASGCGLTPMMTQGSLTVGFKAGESANIYFTEPVTLEQAKAAMLMTRACWAGEGGQSEDHPCTDALGAMLAKWTDAEFKHGLELDADAGAHDGCLRAIRENANPPKDMRSLNKLVSGYWRDWKVAAKRREMEVMREIWRGQEETARHVRGDVEERSGRVPDQSYDLTPPRRALEQARRSRF
jgi:hypothetical protein